MYDFPAAPTSGQAYQGWTWDGEKWAGGLKAQGLTNIEQFFDLSGLASLNISVPSWAKGVEIIGHTIMNGSAATWLYASMDGTTFLKGGTDYSMYGPQPNSGSGSYQAWGSASQGGITLSQQGDTVAVPHAFSAEMSLARSNTSQVFECKVFSRSLDAAAAVQARGWMGFGWPTLAAVGSNLAVKALQIGHGSGTFGAGSWVRMKWIGDLNQVSQGNGVLVDAPSDGCEYVRVNGVWRLKAQTLVLDGLTTIDLNVPTTAKMGRFNGNLFYASAAAANSVVLRASVDGTNFQSGASDYFYGGMAHYNGSSGYANLVATNASYGPLSFASDTVLQPTRFEVTFNLSRVNATSYWVGSVKGGWFHSPATNLYTDFLFTCGISSALSGLRLQKFRFYNVNAPGLFAAPSTISCEWIY